jgi:large subunit ribosomal protein L24
VRKIRKGDQVIVIAGKDKGKTGTVARVVGEERLVVENVNIAKRHIKANPQTGEPGGILDKEMPLHISNVAIFNQQTNKADRIGFKVLDDGRKVRVLKSTQEVITEH